MRQYLSYWIGRTEVFDVRGNGCLLFGCYLPPEPVYERDNLGRSFMHQFPEQEFQIVNSSASVTRRFAINPVVIEGCPALHYATSRIDAATPFLITNRETVSFACERRIRFRLDATHMRPITIYEQKVWPVEGVGWFGVIHQKRLTDESCVVTAYAQRASFTLAGEVRFAGKAIGRVMDE